MLPLSCVRCNTPHGIFNSGMCLFAWFLFSCFSKIFYRSWFGSPNTLPILLLSDDLKSMLGTSLNFRRWLRPAWTCSRYGVSLFTLLRVWLTVRKSRAAFVGGSAFICRLFEWWQAMAVLGGSGMDIEARPDNPLRNSGRLESAL